MTPVNLKSKKEEVACRERRIIVIRAGHTVASLAREIGKSRQWTSDVLYNRVKSRPTRRAIARALGMKVSDLWPNNNKEAA